jgi:hypothetical protein
MDHLQIETKPEVKQSDLFVTPTTASASSSFSFESTGGLFYENLFNQSNNSPPQTDGRVPQMGQDEIENRMKNLVFTLPGSLDLDCYRKLAWIIGKDLDKAIVKDRWGQWWHGPKVLTNMLLSENNTIGKRFHAVYRAEGDSTCGTSQTKEPTTQSSFICQRSSGTHSPDSTYTNISSTIKAGVL